MISACCRLNALTSSLTVQRIAWEYHVRMRQQYKPSKYCYPILIDSRVSVGTPDSLIVCYINAFLRVHNVEICKLNAIIKFKLVSFQCKDISYLFSNSAHCTSGFHYQIKFVWGKFINSKKNIQYFSMTSYKEIHIGRSHALYFSSSLIF